MSVSQEVIRATDSLGGPQAVKGSAKRIAQVISDTGGTPEQANAVTQLLNRLGVLGDEKKTTSALNKLRASMSKTRFSTIGEFAEVVGRGGMAGILESAPLEEVVGRMGQAGAVTNGKEQSAELMEQINRWSESDAARKLVERGTGKKFRDVPYAERMAALGNTVGGATPSQRDKILDDVPEEMRQRVVKFFGSPDAQAAYSDAKGAAESADRDIQKFVNELDAYKSSPTGQAAINEAEKAQRLSGKSDYAVASGLLRDQAKDLLRYLRDEGQISFTEDKLQTDESMLRAAESAVQIERLGETPAAVPGTMGAEDSLRSQLIQAKRRHGISVQTKIVESGSAVSYMVAGAYLQQTEVDVGQSPIIGAGGAVIAPGEKAQDPTFLPRSMTTPAAASQPAGGSPTTVNNIGQQVQGNVYAPSRDPTRAPADMRQ